MAWELNNLLCFSLWHSKFGTVIIHSCLEEDDGCPFVPKCVMPAITSVIMRVIAAIVMVISVILIAI